MSRGIGPVLLTHFTPDEAEADTVEELAPTTDKTKSGALVAPAPTGRPARHRAGHGKSALVLRKPRKKPATAAAAETTSEFQLLEQLRNPPKNMRVLAMTAGAVVLIAIGFGLVRPATELAGSPVPAGPNRANGMQPGTLPDAALSGVPTTTPAPPPSTTQASAPPTTHHTTTHAAPPTTATTQDQPAGSGLAVDGSPCSKPGDFTFDTHYRPVQCATDGSGNLTWQQF